MRLRSRRPAPPTPSPAYADVEEAPLFDEALLSQVRRMSLVPRRRTPEGLAGEHRSRRRGSSPEFADFKAYTAGDDFRRIDWNIYSRLGSLFVRLSEVTTEVPIHILLDVSASMAWRGEPGRVTKFTYARQLAGCLGYLSLHHFDRVTVVPFAETTATPFGPAQGRANIHALIAYLGALRPARGGTDIPASIDRYVRSRRQPGFAVLISDLLGSEPAELAEGLRTARARGWELTLLQTLDPCEADPARFARSLGETGALELIDLESADLLRLAMTGDVVERCAGATRRWLDEVQAACDTEKIDRIVVDTSLPLLDTLRALHDRGITA